MLNLSGSYINLNTNIEPDLMTSSRINNQSIKNKGSRINNPSRMNNESFKSISNNSLNNLNVFNGRSLDQRSKIKLVYIKFTKLN